LKFSQSTILNKILTTFIIVILCLLFFCANLKASIPQEFNSELTDRERYFITNSGVIRVHNETDWAPFNFNEKGVPKGFSIDYMTLLAQKTGLEIKFINGPSWDQFLDMIKQGELDVMLNIAKSPEREEFLQYTPSYVSMIQMLYTRADFPTVSSIKELYGKKFAVPKGFFLQEVLQKNHPQIEIVEVPDTSASIRAVSVGKADALFDLMPVVDYITNQLQITNLKVGGDLGLEESKPIPLHIGVRKEMKTLVSIIDKGMAAISEDEIQKLHEKWLTGVDSNDVEKKISKSTTSTKLVQVVLTKEEQDFIDNIPDRKIRLGIDNLSPPFEYIDENGLYSGISADFIIEAAKRLGLNVVPKKDIKWTEAVEKLKSGEIDPISKVTPSLVQAKFMNFTKPYITFPSVIVSRKDKIVSGLKELHGLKVGVIKGQMVEANLRRDYPEFLLLTAPDIETALAKLSEGRFDVFIDNLGAVAYAIEHLGIVNLRIAASTPYNYELSFGIRKDLPLLASALDKALATMSDQEKTAIKNRWLAIKYEKGIDWWFFGPIGAILLGTTIFVLLWNRRLGKAIKERENVERKIKAMGQAMADALVMLDSQGSVKFWNQAAEKLFGYTEEEAMNKDFHDMAAPSEMIERIRAGLKKFAKTGEGAVLGVTTQITAVNRAGKSFPVEVSLSPFQIQGEWFAVGSVRDITDRKKAEEALKESEKRFRGYFEYGQIGMAVTHPQKGWIEANRRIQDMFGYTLEELRQTTWADLTHPDDLEEDIKNFDRMLAGEINNYSMDKRFIRKDGTIIYTNISISCLRNQDNSVNLVLSSYLDITERKKAQDEISEIAKQHQKIFESSPLGMIRINAEGTIINCNEKFIDLMGSSREKLIGFNSLKQGRDEGMKAALSKAIAGETAQYEADYTSATGGKTVPLHMRFNPVNAKQNPTEVIVVLEDITDRKEAEKKMKAQMEDLEKFSRLTINREERMINLKEEINQLREELGKGKKYKIVE
ncbi:MAG: transporter substrate-binding domain-containing protein, partial [Desulfamplus sp.]|nr:transporter substrate-binding domain-containing protein [Desulfamplus sp.]